jgi:hypothetical protein
LLPFIVAAYPNILPQSFNFMYFLGGGLLRDRPRQHELGLEDRPAALNAAVKGSRHPPDCRMANSLRKSTAKVVITGVTAK